MNRPRYQPGNFETFARGAGFGADAVSQSMSRRNWLWTAAAGSAVAALGGGYVIADAHAQAEARAQIRADGRPRLPPGQRLISRLKPMGGSPGEPARGSFRLKVYGEVEQPFELDFAGLLGLAQVERDLDVHCVTGWTCFDAHFKGVAIDKLIAQARPKATARYAILEGAHGYTANLPLSEIMAPENMIAYELGGRPLIEQHGAPARAIIPASYFWKSAKWVTGIRLTRRDQPGYWERRGYHNHADPWKEERYS